MFDKVKLNIEFKTPDIFFKNKEPVLYKNLLYVPKYNKYGDLIKYESTIKNLKLYLFSDGACLVNSIHKYWHGYNFTDFKLSDAFKAIACISEITGINWSAATVSDIEYGVNIESNADILINSIDEYRGKKYYAMVDNKNGKRYGLFCGFSDYGIKVYDKQYEVNQNDHLKIDKLLRIELKAKKKHLERLFNTSSIKMEDILNPEAMSVFAMDLVNKIEQSNKRQVMNLSGLTASEKKVIAVMQHPQIRDDLKKNNKDTFKRDKRIYSRLMRNLNVCPVDKTGELIAEKALQLING